MAAKTISADDRTVSDLVALATEAIRNTNNASGGGDEDDFTSSSLLNVTRQAFRRSSSGARRTAGTLTSGTSSDEISQQSRSKRRGRKRLVAVKCSIFLLRRSNMDFFPCPKESKFLENNGFGRSKAEINHGKVMINRTWSIEKMHDEIAELYPDQPLCLVGFKIGQCDKGKKMMTLFPESVSDLLDQIGRGKVIVIPDRDLPLPVPTPMQPNSTQPRRNWSLTENVQQTSPPHTSGSLDLEIDELPEVLSPQPRHQTAIQTSVSLPSASGVVESGTPTIVFRSNQENYPGRNDPIPSTSTSQNSDTELFHEYRNTFDLVDVTANPQFEINEAFLALNTSLEGEAELSVSREHILEETLSAYEDSALPLKRLHIQFKGESGDDFGGLTKDFLTNSWKDVLETYFQGEDACVPYLPLHKLRKDRDKFTAIGRLVSHMAALQEILPTRLSRTTLLSIVFGEECISEEILLQDFLLYCSPADRALVKKALNIFHQLNKKEEDSLLNFFIVNSLHEMPSQTKIKGQILSIAQDVLVDRPRPLVQRIKLGIPTIHTELFWSLLTIDSITYLFVKQRPTASKVVEVLKAEEDLRPDQERSLYFFKQFICTLDQEELANLLLFITGSTTMPDLISITFTSTTGIGRCPIAHTCSNVLELPSTYSSLVEMKREFRAVLLSTHSFEMSMF